MTTRTRKPILLGPFPPSHRGTVRRRIIPTCFLALLTACALLLATWLDYHPELVREVDTIPLRVHRSLSAHHARYTPIASISPAMQHAIVAIEDRRFYHHHGIDLHGMARALVADITSRRFDQGGATLTEQLVEGTLPLPRNLGLRATKILALAWVVEEHFSRRRILELYLNAVYYGRGAYGIEAAARRYFQQTPDALDVAHAAFLASLPQAPSAYGDHPFASPLQDRWRTVIRDMAGQGYITRRQELAALQERIGLADPLPATMSSYWPE